MTNPQPTACQGCHQEYESKNALFRHLRESQGCHLTGDDHQHFLQHVQHKEHPGIKSVVLFGYYIPHNKQNGQDAANQLLHILDANKERCTRSYGCASRGTNATQQDDGTSAVTELLCLSLPPLNNISNNFIGTNDSMMQWVDQINTQLVVQQHDIMIRVMGRMEMKFPKFNAEMDVSHRRVEYVLPLDLLYHPQQHHMSRQEFFQQLPSFSSGYLSNEQKERQRPSSDTLTYLHHLKRLRQLLTTHIVTLDPNDTAAVMEKAFHNKKRRRQKQNKDKTDTPLPPIATTGNVLRRKRFHNFTPRGMAHEFLAFRRLDRFYHRATVRFNDIGDRPFMVDSLTGDLFLHGQVPRLIGLFIALARGMIDEQIVECIYDEHYPHLVPTPPAPSFAMVAGEASYVSWEGKAKAILTPRIADRYPNGFNRQDIVDRTTAWEGELYHKIAQEWMKDGVDPDGRLIAERIWIDTVLQPWADRAKIQLKEYQLWKAASFSNDTIILPSLHTIDSTIPTLYEKVLQSLRDANESGNWPSTTPKRQLVIVSNNNNDSTSLSMAHIKAKANKVVRSSAYDDDGASGSFSVGAMPGELCIQPKANELFPELMKAAFELEMALCPHRNPSSTIAINRNAQFRPHTDSGAGAGQSTSLIVALGSFVGGELVVEGEKKDIRYKAIEFNGWTQRHWTMPFKGERYSLVWFTPKGCEGVHGIDLCSTNEAGS